MIALLSDDRLVDISDDPAARRTEIAAYQAQGISVDRLMHENDTVPVRVTTVRALSADRGESLLVRNPNIDDAVSSVRGAS